LAITRAFASADFETSLHLAALGSTVRFGATLGMPRELMPACSLDEGERSGSYMLWTDRGGHRVIGNGFRVW